MEEYWVLAKKTRAIGLQTFGPVCIDGDRASSRYLALMRANLGYSLTWECYETLLAKHSKRSGTHSLEIVPGLKRRDVRYHEVPIRIVEAIKPTLNFGDTHPFKVRVFYSDEGMKKLGLHQETITFVVGARDLDAAFDEVSFRNEKTGQPKDLYLRKN